MPNAEWYEWEGDYSKAKESSVGVITTKIIAHLEKLPEAELKVSSRELKSRLKGNVYPSRSWSRAFNKAGQKSGWLTQGQSLVRAEAVFG